MTGAARPRKPAKWTTWWPSGTSPTFSRCLRTSGGPSSGACGRATTTTPSPSACYFRGRTKPRPRGSMPPVKPRSRSTRTAASSTKSSPPSPPSPPRPHLKPLLRSTPRAPRCWPRPFASRCACALTCTASRRLRCRTSAPSRARPRKTKPRACAPLSRVWSSRPCLRGPAPRRPAREERCCSALGPRGAARRRPHAGDFQCLEGARPPAHR
mmetsp:Transcript_36682/g.82186  ORF Transcript_36682/g.82186 Transcript_36682/m.82186 type:complete len:212 (+) Transcript_36682:1407-2042(+)